jgi:5-methylcytosine-specific restriction endonuclease McrA
LLFFLSAMNQAYLVGRLCKRTHSLVINDGASVDLLIPPGKESFLKDISNSQIIQITGDVWHHPSRKKSAIVRVASINPFAADPSPSSFVALTMTKPNWIHCASFNSRSSVVGILTNSQEVVVKMPLTESRWAKTINNVLDYRGDADLWCAFFGRSELHCLSVAEDRTNSKEVLALEGTQDAQGKRKKSNRVGIGTKLRHEILMRDNCTCQHCGASPRKDPSVVIEVDHIMPVSKGGTNDKSNLQVLCDVCNSGKSNSVPSNLGDPWSA